jgi:hypothetical protein
MVRRTTPSLPQPAVLTAEQIRLGIKRLSARLEELRAFEPTSILDRSNCPELTSLKAAIEDAIVRTFGRDTSDYQLYRNASYFDTGPISMLRGHGIPLGQVHASVARSKNSSMALIEQAIKSLRERLEELGDGAQDSDEADRAELSRKVFIVHGHDEGVKHSVARFISSLDLDPIILHEQPNQGRTVIEKVEAEGKVGFAVVLLTPDER